MKMAAVFMEKAGSRLLSRGNIQGVFVWDI